MPAFKKIYIEITSACNLACSFCPPTRRKPQFMDVSDFRHILLDLKPYTRHIYLHVKGEPLLHPRLDELLDISGELGFRVNLTTNGTLLGKAGPLLLQKPALRQVNISLHSMEEHKHKDEAYQEEYLRSVLSFAREAAGRNGVCVSLRLWNAEAVGGRASGNGPEVEAVGRASGNGPEERRKRRLLELIEAEFKLAFRIEERVVLGSGIKLAERIFLNPDHQFQWPSLEAEEDGGAGFCHGLRTHAAILVDGTVVPCCLDGEGIIGLGNIHQQPFGDIITGGQARRIIEGFSRRTAVEELCRKCGYRRRF